MKRIKIVLLSVLLSVGALQAKNWCETLVNTLNSTSEVDKTMAVNRDPKSHEITSASYDFRFTSGKLYERIQNTLKNHAADVDYYSESGKKNKVIMIRFVDNGRRWSCKLQRLGRNGKQFLVSVTSGTGNVSVMTDDQINAARQQARQAQIEARQAQMEARRQAQQAQMEARRQAQQAQMEARRQAQQARIEARNQNRRTMETTRKKNNANVSRKRVLTQEEKAIIDSHQKELQQAERERNEKLKF